MATFRRAVSRVLHQARDGWLDVASLLDGNPLAEVVAQVLEIQDGLVDRRLVLGGRGAVGLVEIAILEVGRVDAKAGGDVVPKLEQRGVDPVSVVRSLSPRIKVVVHDAQDFKGKRREEV